MLMNRLKLMDRLFPTIPLKQRLQSLIKVENAHKRRDACQRGQYHRRGSKEQHFVLEQGSVVGWLALGWWRWGKCDGVERVWAGTYLENQPSPVRRRMRVTRYAISPRRSTWVMCVSNWAR
jgi:hypothetical protein